MAALNPDWTKQDLADFKQQIQSFQDDLETLKEEEEDEDDDGVEEDEEETERGAKQKKRG